MINNERMRNKFDIRESSINQRAESKDLKRGRDEQSRSIETSNKLLSGPIMHL